MGCSFFSKKYEMFSNDYICKRLFRKIKLPGQEVFYGFILNTCFDKHVEYKSNNSLIVQVFKPFMFQGDGPTIKVYFILFLASSANFQVSMIKILNYRDPMICGHKKYNLVSR